MSVHSARILANRGWQRKQAAETLENKGKMLLRAWHVRVIFHAH
jgi:hypothetical protein